MLSISLPKIFEDQGSGYPLRVFKIALKWTGPVKMLTKGQLGSNLMSTCQSRFDIDEIYKLFASENLKVHISAPDQV